MPSDDLSQRLSRIPTLWTVVKQAHGGAPDEAGKAQGQLLERYSGAIYRYLMGALRNPDAADEVFQEFALRFIRGDFRTASQDRGRFRSFLKTSLYHMIVDFKNKQRRSGNRPQLEEAMEPIVEPESALESDRRFVSSWRDELLARAWNALQEAESDSGQPFYSVLRFRADHPDLSSQQMAERLSEQLGKSLSAASVRQTLHRGREKFADVLLDEVAHYLGEPEGGEIEQELVELGLLEYCRTALDRWK